MEKDRIEQDRIQYKTIQQKMYQLNPDTQKTAPANAKCDKHYGHTEGIDSNDNNVIYIKRMPDWNFGQLL